MADSIVLTGVIGTEPRAITTSEGLSITSFRLASSQRRYDRATSAWVDGTTNWYSVSAFRRLAENAATSLSKGDRVIVTGRMKVREWEGGARSGVTAEIEADALGHDLNWGCSTFVKRAGQGTAGRSEVLAQPGGTQEQQGSASDDEEPWQAPAEAALPF